MHVETYSNPDDTGRQPAMHLLTNGLLVDEHGIVRPAWACSNELLRDYYDTEWGEPITGEQAYFERLCLESFQAGLSWELILRRRPMLREVFANFDPARVAEFTDADVENILAHPGMIRNERKIRAVITNALACVALRDDPDFPGGLEELVRSFAPAKKECYGHSNDVPTKSEESAALAKTLKRKGFSFVGPTTMFALLEAIGLLKYDISPGTPVESAQAQN